jgi:hypothetical protein
MSAAKTSQQMASLSRGSITANATSKLISSLTRGSTRLSGDW